MKTKEVKKTGEKNRRKKQEKKTGEKNRRKKRKRKKQKNSEKEKESAKDRQRIEGGRLFGLSRSRAIPQSLNSFPDLSLSLDHSYPHHDYHNHERHLHRRHQDHWDHLPFLFFPKLSIVQ